MQPQKQVHTVYRLSAEPAGNELKKKHINLVCIGVYLVLHRYKSMIRQEEVFAQVFSV